MGCGLNIAFTTGTKTRIAYTDTDTDTDTQFTSKQSVEDTSLLSP